MSGNRLGLKLIRGHGSESAHVERIALSLVHPRERIDIPVSAILRIEAHGEIAFTEQGTGRPWISPNPHVEICFAEAIRERICQLSRQILDQPWDIVVGGEVVASAIVREPLCSQACFQISANDLAEAHALAHRMRTGWSKAGPRAVT
jgi:hypothetical protein